MALVREALVDTPGLTVCGAAYDGVGIAACIGSAQFAAGQVSTYLTERDNGRMADSPHADSPHSGSPHVGKPKARDLNDVTRYAMWSVFRIDRTTIAELSRMPPTKSTRHWRR